MDLIKKAQKESGKKKKKEKEKGKKKRKFKMENKLYRGVILLHTRRASRNLTRLLSVCNEHPEPGTALLALAEDLPVIPNTRISISGRENRILVAFRIPPASNTGNNLGN
jgi:hypothetical protein